MAFVVPFTWLQEQGSGADAPADQTACDIAVLVADWAGAAAKQSVPLQMLTHAAAARKGHLPPASLAAAVAAGSESACRRLLISQVSLYASNAANSQLALDQANTLLTKMRLPGECGAVAACKQHARSMQHAWVASACRCAVPAVCLLVVRM